MTPIITRLLVAFIGFSLILSNNEALAKKRVCVIGAGRAGLAAIKLTADKLDKYEPIAFERNSDVGGLWIYTDQVGLDKYGLPVHSSVYKNLKTILPKEMMVYPDYLNIGSRDGNSFIPHEEFLEYLRNYTNHFQLRKYVQFNTLVTKVTPEPDRCNRTSSRWNLEKRNLDTKQVETIICDAVMVCNGRFSKPNIPKIPGIETFRGRVLHSRSYRKPSEFAKKTVLILGAQASGIGISQDLSTSAKKIYLSSKFSSHQLPEFRSNVHVSRLVVRASGKKFTLDDGTKIAVDTLIYCTGYLYDFPFLDESSGIVSDGHQIRPLNKGFINKAHQSMAFIGLTGEMFGERYYLESNEFLRSLEWVQLFK